MPAARFLDRLTRGNAPIATLIDDYDGWHAAMADSPVQLGAAFEAVVATSDGPPVAINPDGFASAACDRRGHMVVASRRFADWFDGLDPLVAAVRDIGPGRPRVSLFADDRAGRPVALAAGTQAVARHWPLEPRVRSALADGRASHAVVAFRPGARSWQIAATAFRLTPAEAGLVAALGSTGNLQRAAFERGIAYETARKLIASAMRKAGAKRQTELVQQAMALAAGDVIESGALVRLLCDLFSLSQRQARLAVLVARGARREEAAAAIGASDAVAKADLKTVYQACGVSSAVDLSRIVSEIGALEGLSAACDVVLMPPGCAPEPLRLIARVGRAGRIAIADHGPDAATPVLIFHSNMMGRHHSRRFIAALQTAGYRPIAIERPGFGLTDRVAVGNRIGPCVADVHDVLDALGIAHALVVARCTTASVVAATLARAGRVTGGVLIWPDGPLSGKRPTRRIVDGGRAVFALHPALAPAFGRLLARRSDVATIERLGRSAAEGIAADAALFDDADERADIVRAVQQAALGQTGFVDEALALGLCPDPVQLDDAGGWTLLLGDEHAPGEIADAAAFWSARMPNIAVEVIRDAVNYLYATHTDRVVAALGRADQAKPSNRHAGVTKSRHG